MERVALFDPAKRYHVLALGAHSDDIELGLAGFLARIHGNPNFRVTYAILTGDAERHAEARRAALRLGVREPDVHLFAYPDTRLPVHWVEIKDEFLRLRLQAEREGEPFTHIFTHTRHDVHQDHQVVNQNTWRIWRDQIILEYEILKYEGDERTPNFYVALTAEEVRAKWELLASCFNTQSMARRWFRREVVEGMARVRGVECNCEFAEGFHVHKLVW